MSGLESSHAAVNIEMVYKKLMFGDLVTVSGTIAISTLIIALIRYSLSNQFFVSCSLDVKE